MQIIFFFLVWNSCILISIAANEGDLLCCRLFYDAGAMLAKMVVALKPKVHKVINNLDQTKNIVYHVLYFFDSHINI